MASRSGNLPGFRPSTSCDLAQWSGVHERQEGVEGICPHYSSLAAQVREYRSGGRKILDRTDKKNWPIQVQIIVLVGKPPPEWYETSGQEDVIAALDAVDARLVFYDQLVDNAQNPTLTIWKHTRSTGFGVYSGR